MLRSARRRAPLALAALLCAAGLVAPAGSAQAAAVGPNGQLCSPAGGVSDSLRVTGWVNQERTYDAAALAALPQTTVADTFRAGTGSTSSNFTGVDLARLLELPADGAGTGPLLRPSSPAGPQTPTQRNDITRYSVVVTGSDCFQAVFAMSEISPFFGGKPVLVATAQGDYAPGDLSPVTGSLGAGGFARISNPVDVRGSRRVSNVVEIRVLQAPAETTTPPPAPACVGGPSSSLTIDGFVTAPQTYDAAALAALPQTTVADTYLAGAGSTSANYAGVDLWRLLGLSETDGGIGTLIRPNTPGPQAPAPQRNDLTRYSVMVTGSDCFQALYSLAEISPFFGGNPVVVATAQGEYDPADLSPVTGSLGTSGFARMSVPVDQRGSRRISNVVEIRVLPTPTPLVSWPTPQPILTSTPLGGTQLNASARYAGVSVPGTFTYDRPTGTRLAPGTYTLSGLFVPAQPSSLTIARATTTLTVLPDPAASATTLAAEGPAAVTAGRVTTLRSTLTSTASSRGLSGETVQLWGRTNAGTPETLLATVTTGTGGRASWSGRLKQNTDVQWRYPGRDTFAASASTFSSVRVRPNVRLRVLDASLRGDQDLVVRGRARPAQPGARVVLWRTTDDGRRKLASGTVGAGGRIRLSADLPGAGRYRVLLSVAATDTNAEGTSRTRVVVLR